MEGYLLLQDLAVLLLVAGLTGFVSRRLGLTAVVGYLVAGMIVGPHTPPFSLVTDVPRIQTLSQLGLVFLMFWIGLGISLRRLRSAGLPSLAATALTALLVLGLARVVTLPAGWSGLQTLFFAAIFMVSSSAIISRVLSERGLLHEKFSQRAMSVTLLEDLVAVVMLTILAAQSDGAGVDGDGLVRTLWLMAGFVVLIVVAGMIVVPRLLGRVARPSDGDLKTVCAGGMLFTAAVAAHHAGFSPALGAFLFGIIVAETPFKARIEKALEGTQDLFSAVFFVSIGMLIDVSLLIRHWQVVLAFAGFGVVARMGGAVFAMLATGASLAVALRAGMVLIPLGEFSYIIAQLGVSSGVMPPWFHAAAVGASVGTALLASPLLGRARGIEAGLRRVMPASVEPGLQAYRTWLELLSPIGPSHAGRQIRRIVGQLCVEILLLGAVLGFSAPLKDLLVAVILRGGGDLALLLPAYWVLVAVLSCVLAVAVWRNLEVLGMMLGEELPRRWPGARRVAPLAVGGCRLLAVLLLLLVLWAFAPVKPMGGALLLGLLGAVVLFILLFWNRLVRSYSQLQHSLNTSLEMTSRGVAGAMRRSRDIRRGVWPVELQECMIPESAACAGRSLAELGLRNRFGATVVEIDRQGTVISSPAASLVLYPGDRLLLFGSEESLALATGFLQEEAPDDGQAQNFSATVLETLALPAEFPRSGRPLQELDVFRQTGVQILGIRRGGRTIIGPEGHETLQGGDMLLLLATPEEKERFAAWINGA